MKRSTMIRIIEDRIDQCDIISPFFTNEVIADIILSRMEDHGMLPPPVETMNSGYELVDTLIWEKE